MKLGMDTPWDPGVGKIALRRSGFALKLVMGQRVRERKIENWLGKCYISTVKESQLLTSKYLIDLKCKGKQTFQDYPTYKKNH